MPRKAFVADLQQAIKGFERVNVSNIKAGEDDGQINFDYQQNGASTEIVALVPDLGEYPGSHMYMYFTKSDHVDPQIHDAVETMNDCSGLIVSDMLAKVVKALDKATAGSRHNPVSLDDGADDPMVIDSDTDPDFQGDDEPAGYDSDEGNWSPKSPQHQWTNASKPQFMTPDQQIQKARLRHDLRLAKDAGFRVSQLGSLAKGGRDGFIILSIRVSKLGISEEALDAWHMDPMQYFTILMRYTTGYQTFDDLIGNGPCDVQIRVGLSSRYKLDAEKAIEAFAQREDKSTSRKLMIDTRDGQQEKHGLGRLFIGRPLEEQLNDRLIPLLRYRMAMGFPWLGAEQFFNDHQGRNLDNNAPDARYWADEKVKPSIATHDHLQGREKEKSFPLLTMQYALRHLVRCTEFCLVCHCKVEADFEALKPYVCSKPLCLYQYMSLGFGPSIEHEIITQPHVVDLLTSFCYSSAHAHKLRYLPTGMALMVPDPAAIPEYAHTSVSPVGYAPGFPPHGQSSPSDVIRAKVISTAASSVGPHVYRAKFSRQKMELLFPTSSVKVGLHVGTWITIGGNGPNEERLHCRVIETILPTIRLGIAIIRPGRNSQSCPGPVAPLPPPQRHLSATNRANLPQTLTPATTPPLSTLDLSSSYRDVEFIAYDRNFDDLSDKEKSSTICMLLDTLPTIPELKNYLLSKGNQETTLRHWADRISPAALGLLRWIIASNRSCIVQVDSLEGVTRKSEERVSGMPGWMQFRFAQGAPDKEQRFVTSIRQTTPATKFPTMFAWHGSPLHNWHGIVREGLHFQHASHGRAYGDGVYHALDVQTSLGYSNFGMYSRGSSTDEYARTNGQWPHSQLCISQALALNEIVNAPSQFVSKSPHLVVAQLDWIQSRYLFVKCNVNGWQIPETTPSQVYEQDTSYQPLGSNRTPLVIPLNAVSKARRPVTASVKTGNKKVKVDNIGLLEEPVVVSDDTDIEDLETFFSDIEESQAEPGAKKGKTSMIPTKTDFTPHELDTDSLVLLEPPSYATSMATKALQRELTATLKVQESHPLHELGWYIDANLISNVYQWIVELHSFESHLPIANDLKKRNLKSVVVEIRFGAQYPMSPPFVRVIRPRFLSFMQGGGGHITAGGALCMELLTNSGWSAVSNIESVLLQVRLAMSSTDPKPARLEPGPVRDYQVGEAVEAYIRACHAHGWEVPADFKSNYSGSLAGGSHSLPISIPGPRARP